MIFFFSFVYWLLCSYVCSFLLIGCGEVQYPYWSIMFWNCLHEMPVAISDNSRDSRYYCYFCRCMVATKSQAQISCKMKQVGGIESNCTLFEPWIKSFLVYSLCNPYNFRKKQDFYLRLFREKNLERKFSLSLSVNIVGFSFLKKLLRRMHVIFQRRV